jgi:hypothetical protein
MSIGEAMAKLNEDAARRLTKEPGLDFTRPFSALLEASRAKRLAEYELMIEDFNLVDKTIEVQFDHKDPIEAAARRSWERIRARLIEEGWLTE